MNGELISQSTMSDIVLTYDKSAGRVLIDAVDDPGTQDAVYAGKPFPAVIHQGIDQSVFIMTGSRMDYHILGFVDDQNIIVLINNIKRNVFRSDVRHGGIRKLESHHIFGRGFIICLDDFSVDGQTFIFNQFLYI